MGTGNTASEELSRHSEPEQCAAELFVCLTGSLTSVVHPVSNIVKTTAHVKAFMAASTGKTTCKILRQV